ncbi:MAG: uncharacterized protein JWP74_3911 [Marmoricola sp.]|nr:uncharacterized protein [Marmoricola sp.]
MDIDRLSGKGGREVVVYEGFRVKRLVSAVVATLIAGSLAAFVGVNNSPAAAAPVYTPAFSGAWTPCDDGLECNTLKVPLDYSDPGGPMITLAVSRLKASPTMAYDGMMLSNPGGPGGSGTYLPVLQQYVPNNAGKHYDWVGFDPRGVGQSVPSLHCNSHYFGNDRPNYVPTTKHLMKYWLTKAMNYSKACGRSSAKALLAHTSTRESVLDMESIRAAYAAGNTNPLHNAALTKLNFYGFSYGTYLGQAYAVKYPSKVGRFVLDGVVDPTNYWYGANLQQEVHFDKNINVFFAWIAKHPGSYHLGTSGKKIRTGFNHLLKTLLKHPSDHGKLGPDELTDGLVEAGYYVYDWNKIAAAYSKLVRHHNGAPIWKMYSDANQGDDNGYAMYAAVQCTDVRRPAWSTQVKDAKRLNKKYPFLTWDNTWFNAPCNNWPAASRGKIPINGSGVSANILLINETQDAATPYPGALEVRSLFPTASLIAGVNGTTHAGSLSGVSCVDDRIAAYLATPYTQPGVVPARKAGRGSDVNCPHVPPPSPISTPRTAARSAATTADPGMPLWIRERLMATDTLGVG